MNRTMSSTVAGLCIFAFLAAASSLNAAKWGSIKGRFVVDGEAPEPAPLTVTKDAFCMEANPKNQSIVVGEDGGLANAVVFIRVPRRGNVEVHPDYEATKDEPVVLDNEGCSFEPHIVLVRVGQPLLIKNSDPTGHNTNISVFRFNQTIPANGEVRIEATAVSPLPMPVACNIHPFMRGYLLAQEHPYMVASTEDGTFEIKNIPAGKHEFQFWHEGAGYLKDIGTQSGKTDRRGRAEIEIVAGETLDLGEIKVPASALK